MKKPINLVLIVALLALLAWIFTSILGTMIFEAGSNTFLKETSNKLRTKKAILFLREGNATVSNSYQVSITEYKDVFDTNAVGNVFTVDDDHGKGWLNPNAINFNWLSEDTIEVVYDKNLRVFLQEKNVNKVAIIYKLK